MRFNKLFNQLNQEMIKFNLFTICYLVVIYCHVASSSKKEIENETPGDDGDNNNIINNPKICKNAHQHHYII